MHLIRIPEENSYKTPTRAKNLGATRTLPKFPASAAAALIAISAAVVAPVATTSVSNFTHSHDLAAASTQKVDAVLVAASQIEDEEEAAEYVASELNATDIAGIITDVVAPEVAPAQPVAENTVLEQVAETVNAPAEVAPDYTKITSNDFAGLSQDEKIELIGAMAYEDDRLTGIPGSLTAAQAILESGWMESGLTRDYENYFGIKASSDGYNWPDSTWDGRVADMSTGEEYDGYQVTITAGFRVYDTAWQSICDHSAYLLNNTKNDGAERRYPDIEKCESATDAVGLLVDGGYATSSSYADMLMELVEKYDLTRFDYTAPADSDKMTETDNKSKSAAKTLETDADKKNTDKQGDTKSSNKKSQNSETAK